MGVGEGESGATLPSHTAATSSTPNATTTSSTARSGGLKRAGGQGCCRSGRGGGGGRRGGAPAAALLRLFGRVTHVLATVLRFPLVAAVHFLAAAVDLRRTLAGGQPVLKHA